MKEVIAYIFSWFNTPIIEWRISELVSLVLFLMILSTLIQLVSALIETIKDEDGNNK